MALYTPALLISFAATAVLVAEYAKAQVTPRKPRKAVSTLALSYKAVR